MPYSLKVWVPDTCLIFERVADIGTSVLYVNHGVTGMRDRRNADPETDSACRWIVALNFMVEFYIAIDVAAKNHIIAISVLKSSSIGSCCQIAVGPRDQNRKIALVSIWDLRVIDDDRATIVKRRQ